jgi:hypothetical protein
MKNIYEVKLKGNQNGHCFRVCAMDMKEAIKKIALKRNSYLISERKDLQSINNKLSTN